MDLLFAVLRSLLVVIVFASDDLLLLDLWVITPPGSPPAPRRIARTTWRVRAVAALKTACTYAVVEPLWFHLINGASLKWVVVFSLMSSYCHLYAVTAAVLITAESLKNMLEKHRRWCPGSNEGTRDSSGTALNHVNNANGSPERLERNVGLDRSSPPQDLRAIASAHAHCHFETPLLAKLAPLLPVLTTAAANVGILQYAAFLHTDQSALWFDRFAVGWCAITLLELFSVGAAKWSNRGISQFCNRHVWVVDQQWMLDLGMRVSAWMILLVLRSACRSMLALPMFTTLTVGKDGLALSPATLVGIDVPSDPALDPDVPAETSWWAPYVPWLSLALSVGSFACQRWYSRQRSREADRGGDTVETL